MENKEQPKFQYTYSAAEQAELKQIREKYSVGEENSETDKLAQIKKLDASVTKRATVLALCVGVVSALVMGMGMSLIMTDLGTALGVSAQSVLPVGIGIGMVGMIGVIAAYPLYHRTASRERKRVAPEILRLSAELLNEDD